MLLFIQEWNDAKAHVVAGDVDSNSLNILHDDVEYHD